MSDQVSSGADVGSVNPSADPNDEALLDSLGFGPETKAPVSNPTTVTDDPSLNPTDPVSEYEFPPDEPASVDQPVDTVAGLEEVVPQVSQPEVKIEQLAQEAGVATFTDPKANHAFANLRKQNSDLAKRIKELESEVSKTKNNGPELEQLKTQYEATIQELQDRLGQYDLTSTQGFKQKYDSVLTGMLNKAAGILRKAGASEKDAAEMVNVLRTKSTLQRAEKLNEFVPALSATIVNIFEDFDDVMVRRETELRNWKDSRKSIEEEEKRIKKSKAFEIADTTAASVLRELESERNPFFTQSSTDSGWNKKVEDRSKVFKNLLKTGDSAVLAKLVAEGLAAKEFQKLFLNERKKRKEIEKQSSFSRDLRAPPSSSSTTMTPSRQNKPVSDEELLTNLGF